MKTILITIHFNDRITKPDLVMRRILVDTIEYRALGEVIEETSSPEVIEIVLEVDNDKSIESDMNYLLTSLGYNHYTLQDISSE